MSDGERAIFYLIGQTLCAEKNSLLIIDEPELHVHKSIMTSLWDALEAQRQDCAFIFISHDLDFVASRVGQKFLIQGYEAPGQWELEEVPEQTGFSEEITTKILGSRRPILFVEGTHSSLDYAVYRNCYPGWTVIPRESCENVIHSVVTMRKNAVLTRVTCSGIVDADDFNPDEASHLDTLGIKVLPVSEIENIFLLPSVAKTIGEYEGYKDTNLKSKLAKLKQTVIDNVNHGNNFENSITGYCRRRVDRTLKKIDLSGAKTVEDICSKYSRETKALNIKDIAKNRREAINKSIKNKNITKLLSFYDNKGLISLVAQHMKSTTKLEFENWIVRILGNNAAPEVSKALKAILPRLTAT